MCLMSRYEVAIEQTLLRSGDTDTNAAIVGGLLGALWGASAVPESMSGPVLSYKFDASTDQRMNPRPRPANLAQERILPTAEALLKLAGKFQEASPAP